MNLQGSPHVQLEYVESQTLIQLLGCIADQFTLVAGSRLLWGLHLCAFLVARAFLLSTGHLSAATAVTCWIRQRSYGAGSFLSRRRATTTSKPATARNGT